MKKEDHKKKELINGAIIKKEKNIIIETIEIKARSKDLTKEERIILIDNIYNNYCNKRKKLIKKSKLKLQQQQEADRVSSYMLNAIDNALDKEDRESIQLLINQNKLFNNYFELIMDKNNYNGKEEIESKLIENNKLVKTN